MVVAKHDAAHEELARQFHDREVEKEYVALVWGVVQAGPPHRRADRPRSRRTGRRCRRARDAAAKPSRASSRAEHFGPRADAGAQVAIHTGPHAPDPRAPERHRPSRSSAIRCTAACTAACRATCGPSRISSGRSCTRRGWRSRIRPTAGAWSSRARCRTICSRCSTSCRGAASRVHVADEHRCPHHVVSTKAASSRSRSSAVVPERHASTRSTIVRHPPSVVLIPMHDDGRVVLIRQYRPSVDRELWELPAGSLEPGETAEAAAARECEEEIGLVPRPGRAARRALPGARLLRRGADLLPAVRTCAPPAPGLSHRAGRGRGHPARRPFTVAEARAMVARGEIVDLKTAYGLTLI